MSLIGSDHPYFEFVAAPAPTIDDLGYATVNMSYAAFCAAIDEPDGDYARDKYAAFKALGKAFSALGWSEATITRVVSAYKASRS